MGGTLQAYRFRTEIGYRLQADSDLPNVASDEDPGLPELPAP